MAAVLFWIAAGLIAYHHFAYPAIIRLLASTRKPAGATAGLAAPFPTVTVIVPAHNEAGVIKEKIRNLLALDYPADRLTMLVALDGCGDDTRSLADEAIGAHSSKSVALIEYKTNIGKVAVLNDQIARVTSDIVVLTDASATVAADALIRGVTHFIDPSVGVVTGRYSVKGLEGRGEAVYWRYQSDVRAAESALAGPIGAHGAFYMFRRSGWSPLPADTINDDFVLPMSIVLRGFRAAFEPGIVAQELEPTRSEQEFRRRIRIGAGNLQQVLRLRNLADPRRGWVAFAFLSGKALRGVLPFVILTMLASSFALAVQGSRFFQLAFALEVLLIALGAWGGSIPRLRKGRLTGPMIYLLEGYLALGVGAAYVLSRRGRHVWRMSKLSNAS